MMRTVVLALGAGAFHHLLFQYPNQAEMFVTLYGFALSNAVFLVSHWTAVDQAKSRLQQAGQFSLALLLFEIVFVCSIESYWT